MQLEGMSIPQLKALCESIEERIQQLRYANRKRVRELLIEEAAKEGFSIQELFGLGAPNTPEKSEKVRLTMGIYRNPNDPSQTWKGRGPQPQWLRQAIASGVAPVSLRVDS